MAIHRLPGHLTPSSRKDVRCDMRDAQLAIDTGVDGIDIVIGTSSFLREHSHGKDMVYITKTALEVIEFVKSKGLEVRCRSSLPAGRALAVADQP